MSNLLDSPEALAYAEALALGFQPFPQMSTSEWADRFRWLAAGTGPDPGKYSTDRTPYMREIMDVLSPQHPARRVVVMKGSRLGATEGANNLVGRSIHLDRRSVLFYNPDIPKRNEAKRDRIDPMIEETPVLQAIISPVGARGRNTLTRIRYPGGQLTMAHASSVKQFRASGAPVVICDEIDSWIPIICSEGDKILLAEKRAAGHPQAKILHISSPGERDISPIEREFNRSDQRRFFLRCPDCGRWDFLTWQGYRDHVRKLDGGHYWIEFEKPIAREAWAVCPACEARVPETHKYVWLREGEWRPTAEGDGETVGFHLPSMLAPHGWFSWADLAKEFIQAKDKPDELRVFINTRLGETYEDRTQQVSAKSLEQRLEAYGADVPEGVGILVGGVDTQDDRLELVVVGFGADEQAWVIAWLQFYGDPDKNQGVWQQLDAARRQLWRHLSGQKLRIEALAVDTMGHKTEGAYRYCKARENSKVYAVRGSNQTGQPVIGRPSRANKYRVNLFPVCTDTAKERIYRRLNMTHPGPGYIHLPDTLIEPEEFAAQLTAEKAVYKHDRRGRRKREWIQLRPRNEVLDCMVYALAALYNQGPSLIRSLGRRARRFSVRREPDPAETRLENAAEDLALTEESSPSSPAPPPEGASPAAPTSTPAGSAAKPQVRRRRLSRPRSFINRWR